MMKNSLSYMAMVVVQLAYGGANILIKVALDKGLNQLVFVVYRHAMATLLLAPFAYAFERQKRTSLSFSLMMKIFFLSSLGTTVHLNVYYAGLHYTSPTVASALSNVIPSMTIIIALLFGMEKVNLGSARGRAKVVGTLICIFGSLIFTFWKGSAPIVLYKGKGIIPSSNDQSPENKNWVKGSGLILISYVARSSWLILQAHVYEIYPAPLSLNVIICFFASLQSSLLALFWGRSPGTWKLGWNVQLLTTVYCGVMISGLAYYLQTWCISKKGPVFVSMFSPLLLVIVAIFSAIFFAEKLYVGSLVGALVIIIGLYCVLWGKSTDGNTYIKEEDVTATHILPDAYITNHK